MRTPLPTPLRDLALVLIVGLLAAPVGGCRKYRTLEELEAALSAQTELAAAESSGATGAPLDDGFARVRRLFVPAGSTPFGEPLRFPISRRAPLDRLVTIGPPVCYAVIAFGVGERLDVDVRIEDPDGTVVASDDAPDPFPVVAASCPPAAGTYAVRFTAARGAGDVLAAIFALPQPDAEATDRLAALARRYLSAPRALGPVRSARLEPGEELSRPFALAPGTCYGFAAVGSPGITDLDLELHDDHGTPLVRDLAVDAEPVIQRYCPERGGAFRLRVEPYQGAGDVWWQLFEVAEQP